MCKLFTCVEVVFYPEYLNNWLRFGDPVYDFNLDRRRSLAIFKPGQLFGYIRWHANEYGTQKWRFVIVKAVEPLHLMNRFRGIQPGGEILLITSGNVKVKRVLAQIDRLENDGFDPSIVSPYFYRRLHNRMMINRPVRGYSLQQHEAYLAARKVLA
ncbi:MAG: DUF2840 domain-containing protein [Paracoccaceae bacterium]